MKQDKKIKDILENEEGQAIFELVIFLPVMLYLLVMLLNVGNSINASINQQQATRGYTYYLLKGNSLGFRRGDLDGLTGAGNVNEVSAFIVGWRVEQESSGTKSFGSSYRLPTLPWIGQDPEDCMDKTDSGEQRTECIKIFTIYGICGESYALTEGAYFKSDYPGSPLGNQKNCNFK